MTFLFQCYFHVIFQSIGGSTSAQSTEENPLKAENLKTEGRLIYRSINMLNFQVCPLISIP